MKNNILFILLILSIVISILGSIALFSYLGISFENNNISVLKRAAFVMSGNN